MNEVPTYFCTCSWIGGDPDVRRKKPPTCPACWKIDKRRVEVKIAPSCRINMRCLCCYHARGGDYRYKCDANEAVWPCRFCWAYFPDGGFEVNARGECAACGGTGVHPGDDGDPSKDPKPAACPKCGSDNLAISETYTAYHPYNAETHHAENALGCTSPSEHFDDGQSDYGAVCCDCNHEGTLDAFGMLLVDWS